MTHVSVEDTPMWIALITMVAALLTTSAAVLVSIMGIRPTFRPALSLFGLLLPPGIGSFAAGALHLSMAWTWLVILASLAASITILLATRATPAQEALA